MTAIRRPEPKNHSPRVAEVTPTRGTDAEQVERRQEQRREHRQEDRAANDANRAANRRAEGGAGDARGEGWPVSAARAKRPAISATMYAIAATTATAAATFTHASFITPPRTAARYTTIC